VPATTTDFLYIPLIFAFFNGVSRHEGRKICWYQAYLFSRTSYVCSPYIYDCAISQSSKSLAKPSPILQADWLIDFQYMQFTIREKKNKWRNPKRKTGFPRELSQLKRTWKPPSKNHTYLLRRPGAQVFRALQWETCIAPVQRASWISWAGGPGHSAPVQPHVYMINDRRKSHDSRTNNKPRTMSSWNPEKQRSSNTRWLHHSQLNFRKWGWIWIFIGSAS